MMKYQMNEEDQCAYVRVQITKVIYDTPHGKVLMKALMGKNLEELKLYATDIFGWQETQNMYNNLPTEFEI